MLHFVPPEASWIAFGDNFWGYLGLLFGCPRREARICGQSWFLTTVQHFFEVPGGRTSAKNAPGNRIQQELGCKSGWGGSRGRFLSHLRVTLGRRSGPEGGPKKSRILERFLGGPREGQGVLGQAPLGYTPCSRATGAGEVGEGY